MSAGTSDLAGQRVLVTGAGGFIGSRVCARLVAAGAEVHGVARSASPLDTQSEGVRWVPLDVADGTALERLVRSLRPEVVVHLASLVTGARDRALVLPMFHSNLASSIHLLSASAETGSRVVLAGSIEEPGPDDTAAAVPRSPYAASKWASHLYARMFGRLWEMPVVTLRASMVYGPGQRDRRKLIPETILSLLRGAAPLIGSGRRRSDWIHVDDVAAAFVAAAAATSRGACTVDVGSGEMASVREVVLRLVDLIDPSLKARFGARPDPPDEAGRAADLDTAAALLGWRAKIGLEEGLRDTVRWYRERTQAGEFA